MQKLHLFDETFDQDQTESYELSIQVSLNGFSLCVKDLTRDLFLALVNDTFKNPPVSSDDWHQAVLQIAKTAPWIKKRFKRVVFSYVSLHFALVPSRFFEPNKAKNILSLMFQSDENDEIRHHSITDDSTIIFCIPSQLVTSWLQVQPSTIVVAPCSPAIKTDGMQSNAHDHGSLSLSINHHYGYVVAKKGKKLLHCVGMSTQNSNDIVYHLLTICNSLNLSPNDTTITVTGAYEDMDQLISLTKNFFKELVPFNALPQSQFAYLIGKHRIEFATLFGHSLCV